MYVTMTIYNINNRYKVIKDRLVAKHVLYTENPTFQKIVGTRVSSNGIEHFYTVKTGIKPDIKGVYFFLLLIQ